MQRKWPKVNPKWVNYEFEFIKKAVSIIKLKWNHSANILILYREFYGESPIELPPS